MQPPKLLDHLRLEIRGRQLSRRTEKAYAGWVRRFVLFHGKRHPREMAEAEVNAFLAHLAADRNVSSSTQTQALSALLFLYRHVLRKELGELELLRPRRRRDELNPVLVRTTPLIRPKRVVEAANQLPGGRTRGRYPNTRGFGGS